MNNIGVGFDVIMNINKIIFFVIVVLIVVILGEFIYFYFFINKTPQVDSQTAVISTIPSQQVSEPTPTATQTPNNDLNERQKLIQGGVLKGSVITDTFDAILASIDLNGRVEKDKYDYRVKLGLQVGDEIIPIFISKDAESRIKVNGASGSPITLENLKPGDHIMMIRKLNTDSGDIHTNVIEVQITKLNE